MSKRLARLAVERRLERQRAEEAKTDSLRKLVSEQCHISTIALCDERADAIRRRRTAHAQQKEIEAEKKLQAEDAVKQLRDQQEINFKLSEQEKAQQKQKVCEAMRRMKICMESDEIRRLKEQLKSATVTRERAAQILERQIRQAETALNDAQMDLIMEERRLAECEEERKKEIKRLQLMRNMGQEQIKQILEKQAERRRGLVRNYVEDRKMVGDIVEKFLKEIEVERHDALRRRERQRLIIEEAAREREALKQRQLEEKKNQEREIREYLDMQKQRADEFASEQERRRKEKARILGDLLKQQQQKMQQDMDYAQVLAELHEHEAEEKERCKEEAQRQKRLQEKAELLAAFREQMEEKERRRQEELKEEEQFRKKMLEEFARQNNLEILTRQRRQLMIREHNQKAEALLQERRRRFEDERRKEQEEHRRLVLLEAEKQNVIKEERERLLREYAGLAAFLPKHTLRSDKEVEIVSKAKEEFANLEKTTIDSLKPRPRTITHVQQV